MPKKIDNFLKFMVKKLAPKKTQKNPLKQAIFRPKNWKNANFCQLGQKKVPRNAKFAKQRKMPPFCHNKKWPFWCNSVPPRRLHAFFPKNHPKKCQKTRNLQTSENRPLFAIIKKCRFGATPSPPGVYTRFSRFSPLRTPQFTCFHAYLPFFAQIRPIARFFPSARPNLPPNRPVFWPQFWPQNDPQNGPKTTPKNCSPRHGFEKAEASEVSRLTDEKVPIEISTFNFLHVCHTLSLISKEWCKRTREPAFWSPFLAHFLTPKNRPNRT